MNRSRSRLTTITALLAVLISAGCGEDSPNDPGGGPGPAGPAPDFAILDVNPNSSTSAQPVSPRDYLNQVSAWYFGHATWGYCRSQFGYLDQMQGSLAAESTAMAIQILGVNGIGQEAGNAEVCANRTTPWLQDMPQDSVWAKWEVTYRDVVVLDSLNRPVAVFNLTEHDLADPSNYDSLRSLLMEKAGSR